MSLPGFVSIDKSEACNKSFSADGIECKIPIFCVLITGFVYSDFELIPSSVRRGASEVKDPTEDRRGKKKHQSHQIIAAETYYFHISLSLDVNNMQAERRT